MFLVTHSKESLCTENRASDLNFLVGTGNLAFHEEILLYDVKFLVGNNNIGPFSGGGFEKPNPARRINTLADGS